MSKWLYRITTKWLALVAAVVFVGFVLFVLPAHTGAARGEASAAEGPAATSLFAPDLSLWYSPASLYELAKQLGDRGRVSYVREHFTFDLAWPAVYLFFLVIATTWLSSLTVRPESWRRNVNLIPFAAVTFDLLENTATSLAISRYPAGPGIAGVLAPVFTVLKWTTTGLAVLVLAAQTIAAILRALKEVRKSRECSGPKTGPPGT